ncbi:MAG: hypothetical protein KGQ59_09700 [Bdellovibrionales bacterium]|nr:hypothetical protein [Bdellovibrionales bacterium]
MDGLAAENQGWFAYSVLMVVAGLAVAAPIVVSQILRFFGGPPKEASVADSAVAQSSASEGGGSVPRVSVINTRYFTAVQVGVLISLPLLLMIPLAIQQSGRRYSSVALLTLTLTAIVSLVYSNRKGDLKRIASARGSSPEPFADQKGVAQ